MCQPSARWLGSQSLVPQIRESGMWQKQHLYLTPLTSTEIEALGT
jgi:hypothetical protein